MTGSVRRLTALAGALLALPGAAHALTWSEFVGGLGRPEPPAAVVDYLKSHPLVKAAPQPRFSEIRTETADGSIAQAYRLTGFDGGFGRIEGVREERAAGTARSGAQTLAMTTTLGGLVLVALENRTTGATVFLRKIALDGDAFFPPAPDRSLSMSYERVQLTPDSVIEETRDCKLTWSGPVNGGQGLISNCTGTTKVTRPNRDGQSVATTSSNDTTNANLVLRQEIGWILDARNRVLDFKRAP